MLQFLDIFYSILHFVLIGFNLLGWIWSGTRKIHFVSLLVTLVFWYVAGYWYGWGYCPLTDWQWQVKYELGERNLPSSFVKYIADKITGGDINADLVDGVTFGLFMLVIALSVYVNFIRKRESNG